MNMEAATFPDGDQSSLDQILAEEHHRRAAGAAPRLIALSTNEIALLRIAVNKRVAGAIAVPLPVSVGIDDGMIVLAYEQTDANREMARRVAEAIAGEGKQR